MTPSPVNLHQVAVTKLIVIDGGLAVVEAVTGDELLQATRPFPYAIRPVDLLP